MVTKGPFWFGNRDTLSSSFISRSTTYWWEAHDGSICVVKGKRGDVYWMRIMQMERKAYPETSPFSYCVFVYQGARQYRWKAWTLMRSSAKSTTMWPCALHTILVVSLLVLDLLDPTWDQCFSSFPGSHAAVLPKLARFTCWKCMCLERHARWAGWCYLRFVGFSPTAKSFSEDMDRWKSWCRLPGNRATHKSHLRVKQWYCSDWYKWYVQQTGCSNDILRYEYFCDSWFVSLMTPGQELAAGSICKQPKSCAYVYTTIDL